MVNHKSGQGFLSRYASRRGTTPTRSRRPNLSLAFSFRAGYVPIRIEPAGAKRWDLPHFAITNI
jgi:hypothetical protein